MRPTTGSPISSSPSPCSPGRSARRNGARVGSQRCDDRRHRRRTSDSPLRIGNSETQSASSTRTRSTTPPSRRSTEKVPTGSRHCEPAPLSRSPPWRMPRPVQTDATSPERRQAMYQRCISSGSTGLCRAVRSMSVCADITPARSLRSDTNRYRTTRTDTSVFPLWEQEAGSSNLPTPTTSDRSGQWPCITDVSVLLRERFASRMSADLPRCGTNSASGRAKACERRCRIARPR
jgi:hypothetical protein